jgi:hypothetical protein
MKTSKQLRILKSKATRVRAVLDNYRKNRTSDLPTAKAKTVLRQIHNIMD